MKIIDCVQGSEEWKQARCAKITASNIADVLSRSRDRKSEGSVRRNFKARVISEILTGRPQENGFTNKAMEDGRDLEPIARGAYEVAKGLLVEQVGFIVHPSIERAGASPDGLVDQRGIVQFKCAYPATHIGYILAGEVPSEYQPQMLWEMACAEREFCDFVSYCPSFPPHLQLYMVRFPRDEQRIVEITAEVNVFLREVDEIIKKLTGRKIDEYLARLGMKEAVF